MLGIFAALLLALAALPAAADPPERAIRLSFIAGTASFSPAGSDDWVQARINRPLWIGDRLWSAEGRVELQLGGASLRLAPRTSLTILNFDNRLAQFEITQGSVSLHVRALDRDDSIEINTPSFAFVTREEGDYRIDVESDRTAVSVRRGFADVYAANVSYRVDRREQFLFYGQDLRDYDAGPLPPPDGFDRWARERTQREDRAASARYVSPELVGYVDLDAYGDWRVDASYGNVWVPRVAADWAPYRYGNWTWIDPWGWTWIDDAPWGYAPSHYGRWTLVGGRSWAWVPGPRNVRPVYAPALVAWVGGSNFSLTLSTGSTRGVAWLPLAPGEVWRPAYDVSRDYFTRVNVANTVVNNTTVINVYNNVRNDVRIAEYRHYQAPAAITAVPVETFVRSRPVQAAAVRVSNNAVAQASVTAVAPAQPVVQSFIGSAPATQAKPPGETMRRQVVARTAPAAATMSLEEKAALVRERGKPVDRADLDRVAPRAAQGAAPAQQAPATTPPGAPQAPAASVAPGQSRSNVRVVEADRAQPKPLPPAPAGGQRAARPDGQDTLPGRAGRAEGAATPPAVPPSAGPAQVAPSQTTPPRAAPGRDPATVAPPAAGTAAPPAADQPGRGDDARPPRGGPPPARPGTGDADPRRAAPGAQQAPEPPRTAPSAPIPPPAADRPGRSDEGGRRAVAPKPEPVPQPRAAPPPADRPAQQAQPLPQAQPAPAPPQPPAAIPPGQRAPEARPPVGDRAQERAMRSPGAPAPGQAAPPAPPVSRQEARPQPVPPAGGQAAPTPPGPRPEARAQPVPPARDQAAPTPQAPRPDARPQQVPPAGAVAPVPPAPPKGEVRRPDRDDEKNRKDEQERREKEKKDAAKG